MEQWFQRYGKWTLFFGYFIAGVRHFTALAAGMSKVKVRTFMLYAYPGGFVWVVCFVSIGYYLGAEWENLARRFNRGALIAVGVVAALSPSRDGICGARIRWGDSALRVFGEDGRIEQVLWLESQWIPRRSGRELDLESPAKFVRLHLNDAAVEKPASQRISISVPFAPAPPLRARRHSPRSLPD